MLKLTGKTLKLLLTTIALPKTEKYNRKSIDLCLKMTIRRYPGSLQNACGPVGISIELNAKTSRDDVKIATDYNCFAKDRKYNRKSINLRLKLTIRRLSRFLHLLLTNICVQLKLFYPAGRESFWRTATIHSLCFLTASQSFYDCRRKGCYPSLRFNMQQVSKIHKFSNNISTS